MMSELWNTNLRAHIKHIYSKSRQVELKKRNIGFTDNDTLSKYNKLKDRILKKQ